MTSDFEQTLQKYAELALKVGLNLQPGQRLIISDPTSFGVPFGAAPLVRRIAASAYRMGARLVDVIWRDDEIILSRFRDAPRDSFNEYHTWQAAAHLDYASHGDAILSVRANDPDLLNGQDPELVALVQKTARQHLRPAQEYTGRNATNWLVIGASIPGWAAKVFPGMPQEAAVEQLWNTIFKVCRLDQPDPVAAWQTHNHQLAVRSSFLNERQYAALHFSGPGTNLTVGLPKGHVWKSGSVMAVNGITFTPNLPTEEVFTLPHKAQTQGTVRVSKPLTYGGALIENFSLTFEAGRVVKLAAEKGEEILRSMIGTDEGAGRLGEVALVPHSSPISQSGLLFYNTLYDENAASHIALGKAYKFTLQDGERMSDEEFAQSGGNASVIHVDFMIGNGEMDVDGVCEDGATEPVMRAGEWAFDAN